MCGDWGEKALTCRSLGHRGAFLARAVEPRLIPRSLLASKHEFCFTTCSCHAVPAQSQSNMAPRHLTLFVKLETWMKLFALCGYYRQYFTECEDGLSSPPSTRHTAGPGGWEDWPGPAMLGSACHSYQLQQRPRTSGWRGTLSGISLVDLKL